MVIDKNPTHWKLRFFYYNPEDRRIFVPKRSPILGWTFNLARPALVVVTALLFAVLIAFAIVNNLHPSP